MLYPFLALSVGVVGIIILKQHQRHRELNETCGQSTSRTPYQSTAIYAVPCPTAHVLIPLHTELLLPTWRRVKGRERERITSKVGVEFLSLFLSHQRRRRHHAEDNCIHKPSHPPWPALSSSPGRLSAARRRHPRPSSTAPVHSLLSP